jgi:hypothetical protein
VKMRISIYRNSSSTLLITSLSNSAPRRSMRPENTIPVSLNVVAGRPRAEYGNV